MRSVVIETGEGQNSLALRDVEDPLVGPDDLLVEVHAAALNRADLRRAPSHFARSESRTGPAIGGLEMAGEVIATGSNVSSFAVGDRVMAMSGGSWAEKVSIDHRLALSVPESFDWASAAATPISFITAHDALVSTAALRPGESVLVRGASSAAGLAAIQIARDLGAGAVFGTTNSESKLTTLEALGCQPLNSGDGPLAQTIQGLTQSRGVDVVIDIVGAGVVQDNIDAAAVGGRIVCVGRLAGSQATLNLDEFSRKRIRMIGVTFRTRTPAQRIAAVALFREQMLPRLESGALSPVIDRSFPLAAIEEAESYVRENHNFGKVIIDVRSTSRRSTS